eukprot:2256824-Amphidinium_carterae.1
MELKKRRATKAWELQAKEGVGMSSLISVRCEASRLITDSKVPTLHYEAPLPTRAQWHSAAIDRMA